MQSFPAKNSYLKLEYKKILFSINKIQGIKPIIWDPIVQSDAVPDRFERIDSLKASPSVDCVVISTAHRQVLEIDWESLKDFSGCSSIYDGRRAMNKDVMSKLGWNYSGVGASST